MNLDLLKELRHKTGASVKHCHECLREAGGDFDKAIVLLRKKGAEIADKKNARETSEGAIGAYLHSNNKIAALVSVKCETDFVARNEEFIGLSKDLAMHVAAMNPQYLSPDNVPAEVIDKEKEIEQEKLSREGKPSEMIEKILEGKINKFFSQVCLLKQPFVKDDKITIEQLIQQKIQKLGEKIEAAEFVRMEL